MSLLTSAIYPELDRFVGRPERRAPEVTYVLTHTGAGWTLLTRHHARPVHDRSTPLAQHGAGTDASPRVAQAVGVRVLHDLGVEVTGWSPEPGSTTDRVARITP